MDASRRDFLKNATMLAAGSAILGRELFTLVADEVMLGIQLYSVREDMGKDPMGTLKQISGMGYRYVEHANYKDRKFYGYTAPDFKKVLDDLGLKMHSGHTNLRKDHWDESKNDFTDAWKHTVEDAATAGQLYVISPWIDEDLRKDQEGLKKLIEKFNKSGELCKKSGMKFGYHNHDFEFNMMIGDMRFYDYILKNTDPALVTQQLDIGNLFNGGAKALDIVQQFPGRFELMHVKDEVKSTEGNERYQSTILGKGIVSTKEVIDLGRKSGTKYFIVEQESYQGKSALDCAKEDFQIMKDWGY